MVGGVEIMLASFLLSLLGWKVSVEPAAGEA
jgi:hypothetical protein